MAEPKSDPLPSGDPRDIAAAASRASPDDGAALAAIVEALHGAGHSGEALDLLGAALRVDAPRAVAALTDPELLLQAGIRLGLDDYLEAALAVLNRALAADPSRARAWTNRAVALCKLGCFAEALRSTRAATALEPGCAEARFGSAVALLALGDWQAGFREYEARWDLPGAAAPRLASPRWQGEVFAGRTLLVQGEQGFGDMLHFVRFVRPAAALGGRVILRVPKPLHRLFTPVAPCTADPVPHDVHCPLMSLPGVLGLSPETAPVGPYLTADPRATAAWRGRFAGASGLRVGLVWSGGGKRDGGGVMQPDAGRSVPLACLESLGAVAGVRFVSLQLGESAAGLPFPALDVAGELRDFADTAAVMAALDLVISVDTAAVHLAGALGRPVWLLRRFAVDWRFPGDETSPWYPTMRIFAQPRPGDWATPVRRMSQALADMLA